MSQSVLLHSSVNCGNGGNLGNYGHRGYSFTAELIWALEVTEDTPSQLIELRQWRSKRILLHS